jgi:accessory gene regulator B
MRASLAERITNQFIDSKLIDAEDSDIYTFGLQQGGYMLLSFITALGIGLSFGMFLQSMIFLLAYIPLRSYAGGYHEKNQLRCYLLSIFMTAAVLLMVKYIPWNGLSCFAVAAAAGSIIFFMAPVEDRNKLLGRREKHVYKRRARYILGILTVIACFLWRMGSIQSAISIIMAFATLGAMLVLGKIRLLQAHKS